MTAQPAELPPTPPDLRQLFDAHAAALCRALHALTGNREAAEDIVQDTFVYAQNQREQLVDGPGMRAWLFAVAIHRVRHHWRGNQRYGKAIARFAEDEARHSAPVDPELAVARRQSGAQILATVAKLPEGLREVFVLYEIEQLDGREIASALEIPINTVWTRLHRARAAFREHWIKARGDRP
jgi:RNA polymerase sigma-70 factor (ECF subfamily)